jgi:hypothetical protein
MWMERGVQIVEKIALHAFRINLRDPAIYRIRHPISGVPMSQRISHARLWLRCASVGTGSVSARLNFSRVACRVQRL